MRILIFVIIILAILGGAFIIYKNKNSNPNMAGLEGKAVFGKPGMKEPEIDKIWADTLKGKWSVEITESSDRRFRLIKGDLTITPGMDFELYVNEKTYSGFHTFPEVKNSFPKLTEGGSIKGKCKIINDFGFMLSPDECNIKLSYADIYYEKEAIKCDYFHDHVFGNTKNNIYVTEIQRFTRDSILITGKNHSSDGQLNYLFIRQ